MARGVDGRDIFNDDEDRRNFLRITQRLKTELAFSVLAYCLMDNHFHFAIKVARVPLARIMHRLLTTYVLGFNTRHERQGHLFQARYKAFLCLDDRYLLTLIPYIHLNPVRAGLISSPADWPWSSHRHYSGHTDESLADKRLFLAAANAVDPNALDYAAWSMREMSDFQPWPSEETVPALIRSEGVQSDSLDDLAASMFPMDWGRLRSGSRCHDVVRRKALLADKAISSGHSLVSVAAWMNCTPPAVHHLLRRNK